MGKVSAMSRPQIATVISFACFMAHLGRRYHQVSSKRRAVRLVRRIDHLSMLCPSKPNSAGSKVTDKSAAKPTAEMEPSATDLRKACGKMNSPEIATATMAPENTTDGHVEAVLTAAAYLRAQRLDTSS